MKTVELCQAYCWSCEDCGRENFVRSVSMSSAEVTARFGPISAITGGDVDDDGDGLWVMAPDRVTCGHCGSEFATEEV